MLNSIFQRFRNLKQPGVAPIFHTSEYGNYYAKLLMLAASYDGGDPCPLLRTIITNNLGCGEITEFSGEGGEWWSFTYKETRFTCELLIASCGGSELYPTSCTVSTEPERELLRELVEEIVRHAEKRSC